MIDGSAKAIFLSRIKRDYNTTVKQDRLSFVINEQTFTKINTIHSSFSVIFISYTPDIWRVCSVNRKL